MADVVSIRGEPLSEPGEPNPLLVKFLEEQLESARAGKTIGFAGATLDRDRTGSFHLAGMTGGFSMVGALNCALRRLTDIAMGSS